LIEVAGRSSAGHHLSMFFQPQGTPPRQALSMLARSHYANELADPGSSFGTLAARFEASLAIGAPVQGYDLGPFLRSLRASAGSSPPPPGSDEAAIDALCEMGGRRGALGPSDDPPAFLRLAERGFGAVPSLIAHLGDERLTHTVRMGFNNFPTY